MDAIEVTGLVKSFGDQRVLDGLDLQRPRAERCFALLGPNGAGKTTLIKILSTLLVADAGRARVGGFDVITEPEEVRRLISLTGQHAAVDDVLTGAENLVLMARLERPRDRPLPDARAAELLERVRPRRCGPPAGRHATPAACDAGSTSHSGLVTAASVIFLDEPTTGLDTRSRQALWDDHRRTGRDEGSRCC